MSFGWKKSAPTSDSCENVLRHSDFASGNVHTRRVDDHMSELAISSGEERSRYVVAQTASPSEGFAGARVGTSDPLALFAHEAKVKAEVSPLAALASRVDAPAPDGAVGLKAPIQGTLVSIDVQVGGLCETGTTGGGR